MQIPLLSRGSLRAIPRMSRAAVLSAALVLLFPHLAVSLPHDLPPVGQDRITIVGVRLEAGPESQTVPRGTPTVVTTRLVAPGSGSESLAGALPADTIVRAELFGPGLASPKEITTRPNEPLQIPALTQSGDYTLANIRLEGGGATIMDATPPAVAIKVIDRVIATQVSSRPMSLDEIEKAGIVINEKNFTVYEFTVGILTESKVKEFKLPVVVGQKPGEKLRGWGGDRQFNLGPSLPSLAISGFGLKVPDIDDEELKDISIPGVIIIPGNVAFLNQFFEVLLLLSNVSPAGSNLVVTDLTAKILLPPGNDYVPGTSDDPLRLAETKEGVKNPVDILNKVARGREIAPAESGEGQFFVEGMREGTHEVRMEITGTLLGLPRGPVPLKGEAIGTVLVRNPTFSLTFAHPDVVREGEEYSLFVTVSNTSAADANLVSLNLKPHDIFGATLVSDSDPETELGTTSFRTIKAGSAATAEYRVIARKTGRVTATAFTGDDGLKGLFRLRMGVGELGIPLSPNTLRLPSYVQFLPKPVVEQAMRVLGLAYSAATVPKNGPPLPGTRAHLSLATVEQRIAELALAGLRIELNEPGAVSAAHWLLDWLGNENPDAGFDEIMRFTDAGQDTADAVGKVLAEAAGGDLFGLHRSLGDALKFRPGHVSVFVAGSAADLMGELMLEDGQGRIAGRRTGSPERAREIPGSAAIDLDADPLRFLAEGIVFGQAADGSSYTVRMKGQAAGSVDVSLILPSAGGFRHAVYRGVPVQTNSLIKALVTVGGEAPSLSLDLDGDGTFESEVSPAEVVAFDFNAAPKLIGAVQIPEADFVDRGRAVGLLFDKAIDPATTGRAENYLLTFQPGGEDALNRLRTGRVLQGNRIAMLLFETTISPRRQYALAAGGIADPDGRRMEETTVPVRTSFNKPGGAVGGVVRGSDGTPRPGVSVSVSEQFADEEEGYFWEIVGRMQTDARGRYLLPFIVAEKSVKIEAADPGTDRIVEQWVRISQDGQQVVADLVFAGYGTVGGGVVDAETLAPVPGARVVLQGLNDTRERTAVTGGDGRFLFEDVIVGTTTLTASTPGGWRGGAGANLDRPGLVLDVTVPVFRLSGSLRGRVLRADGVTPFPGARLMVTVRHAGGEYQKILSAGTSGEYRLDGVPAGEAVVKTADFASAEQVEAKGVVRPGAETAIDLVLPGTASIFGTVLWWDGRPVSGAKVAAGMLIVDADANGNYRIDGVPRGRITVQAARPETGEWGTVEADIVSAGEAVRVDVRLDQGTSTGTVHGHVRDPQGRPAAGQRVELWIDSEKGPVSLITATERGLDQRVLGSATNANGYFAVAQVPLGRYYVRAVKADLTDGAEREVTLTTSGQIVDADLKFAGTGTVAGVVLDPDGVSPRVSKVTLTKHAFDRFKRTAYVKEEKIADEPDANGNSGRFTFKSVRVGPIRVEAFNAFHGKPVVYEGYVREPGDLVDLKLVLKESAVVRGQVYLANGEKAGADLPVTLVPSNNPTERAVLTRPDGTFEFTLVPSGRATVHVLDPRTGNRGIATASIGTGDEVRADLRLLGQGRARVKVVDAGGNSVPGPSVRLRSGSPVASLINEFSVLVGDAQGEVVFEGVPEGRFSVTASDPVSLAGGSAGGEIAEDLQEVSITVVLQPSGTVQGAVLGPTGAAGVPFARVELKSAGRAAQFAVADSEGRFRFEHVPLGNFDLEVFDPRTGRMAKGSGSLRFDGETAAVNLQLDAQGIVEGRVLTAEGLPVAKAQVEIKAASLGRPITVLTTSNLDGAFRFMAVPQGSFTLSAIDPVTTLEGSVQGSVASEAEVVSLDVRLASAGRIEGRVLAADGAVPVPYAQVTLRRGIEAVDAAVADGEGRFAFGVVPLGTYTLFAQPQTGRDSGSTSITLDENGRGIVADVLFAGTGTIRGTVVTASGDPVTDPGEVKVVQLKDRKPVTYTAFLDAGRFFLSDIPVGPFSVQVKFHSNPLVGALSGSLNAAGEMAEVSVLVEPSGSLRGTVRLPDGVTPARDVRVQLAGTSGTTGRSFVLYAASGEDGGFEFPEIPLGTHSLAVSDFKTGGTAGGTFVLTSASPDLTVGPFVLDDQAPRVTSISPSAGTGGVARNAPVTIAFSEPLLASTVNDRTIRIAGANGPIPGTIALDGSGTVVTFTPSESWPESARIDVSIMADVRDLSGRPLGFSTFSDFVTADETPPTVRFAKLILGGVTAQFSETVMPGSGTFSVRTPSGDAIPGIVNWSAGNTVSTFVPAQPIPTGMVLTAELSGFVDPAGNLQAGTFSSLLDPADEMPPVIALSSSSGAEPVIRGTNVTVRASQANGADLYLVDFYVGGQLVKTAYALDFSLTLKPAADTLVEAVPVDFSGNRGGRASLALTVGPDAPPAVSILSPTGGAAGSGKTLEVGVEAGDDLGLASVTLAVRGSALSETWVYPLSGERNVTRKFRVLIPPSAAPGATLTFTASAKDVNGAETSSGVVELAVVDKTLPSVRIASFTQGFQVEPGQTVPVAVQASDNAAVGRLVLRTEGFIASETASDVNPPSPSAGANFSLAVPAEGAGKPEILLRVLAEDTSGNVGEAPPIKLTVRDVVPPAIERLSPAAGSVVLKGTTVELRVRASDNDRVSKVDFLLDGQVFATAVSPIDNAGTYKAYLNVTAPAGTVMNLAARAVDPAGNAAETLPAAVAVVEDAAPPTVAVVSPADGSSVSPGSWVTLRVRAEDAFGVRDISYSLSGAVTGGGTRTFSGANSSETADFGFLVPSSAVEGGTIVVTAVARDRAGNAAQATAVWTVSATVKVVGTVRGPDGQPRSGVDVTLRTGAGVRTAVTDALGRYSFDGVAPGPVVVTAEDTATGFLARGDGTAADGTFTIDLTLAPMGHLAGTVFGRDGLTPVGAGVTVALPFHGRSTVTAADGTYLVEFVPLGEVRVEVQDGLGNRGRTTVSFSSSGRTVTANVAFLGKGTVTGTVRDGGGSPAAGANVTVKGNGIFGGSFSSVTDAGGQYSVEGVFVGPVSVAAQDPVSKLGGVAVGEITAEGQNVTVNVVLSPSGTITGTVFRAGGVDPAAGVEVTLMRGYAPVLTQAADAAGRFTFEFVPIGSFALDAADPATGDRGRADNQLTANGETRTVNVTFLGLGQVSVTVKDAAGEVVSNAAVMLTSRTVFGGSETRVTGRDGTILFDRVLAGGFQVAASDPVTGLAGSASGTVVAGGSAAVTVALQAAGSIRGTVFGVGGTTPLPNAAVQIKGAYGYVLKTTETAVDGTFRFDFLPATGVSYTIEAVANGKVRARETGIVLASHGQEVARDLALSGFGTVAGTVYDPAGQPVAGQYVSLNSSNPAFGGSYGTNTNASGAFTFADVPTGVLRISAADYANGWIGETTGSLSLDGETITVDVRLLAGAVSLPARLADGNAREFSLLESGAFYPSTCYDCGAASIKLLEFVAGGQAARFTGARVGVGEESGREIVVRQQGLAGLDVIRKAYVPKDGYFARYMEILTNPTAAPVTVDVRVVSEISRYLGPVIAATSSGDSVLDVTGTETSDRWVVLGGREAWQGLFVDLFDGPGGAGRVGEAAYAVDGNLGTLSYAWKSVTLAPGETAAFLHFSVQQESLESARASAERLVQLPPEALAGLSSEELLWIRNFVVPPDGSSLLPPLPPANGRVAGSVLAHDGVTPVPGTRIELRSRSPYLNRVLEATSDAAGAFAFGPPDAIPMTDYDLTAVHPQTSVAASVAGSFAGSSDGLARTDVVFAETGSVRGVVRKADGSPAAGAEVRLTRTDPPLNVSTLADANGEYVVTGVPAGSFGVSARWHPPSGWEWPLTAEGTTSVAVGQTVQVDLVLPATGAVAGVVRKATGEVAGNVLVRAIEAASGFYRHAYTNPSGQFTLTDLLPGVYTLTAREPASGAETAVTVTVAADQTATQDLTLVALGTLNITVTRANGSAVASQAVYLTALGCNQCYRGSTDSAGKLTVPNVSVGAFTVRVNHPQSYSVYREVAGTLSAQGEVQAVSVVLPAVADVRVTAVKPGGAVVSGGTVYVRRGGADSYAGRTNSSGVLLVPNQTEGPLTVLLYVGAQVVGEAALTIGTAQDGTTVDAPIVFYTGAVRGKVTAGDGATPVIAQVGLVRMPEGVQVTTIYSSMDGTYAIGDLAPGSYRVTAALLGATTGADVSLAGGGEAVVDLSLPLSVVKGKVTFYDGTPAPYPNVFAVSADGSTQWPSTTGEDGSFVVVGVSVGAFTLKAQDGEGCGLRGSAAGTIADPAVSAAVDVSLEPHGTVRGTVTGRLRTDTFVGVSLVTDQACWADVDGTGSFEFPHAPLRPATVLAREHWWGPDFPVLVSGGDARAVLASPSEIATVDVAIRPLGTVSGTVRDGGGTLVSGATVRIRNWQADGIMKEATTDAAGTYSISGVPVGEAEISALAPDGSVDRVVMSLSAGAPLNVDLVVGSAAAFPVTLDGTNGFRAVFSGSGAMSAGGRTDGSISPVPVWTGAFILDPPFVWEFPEQVGAELAQGGREILLGPVNLPGDLVVSRRVFVPASGGFVRYLEILTNRGSAPLLVAGPSVSASLQLDTVAIALDATQNRHTVLSSSDGSKAAVGIVLGGVSPALPVPVIEPGPWSVRYGYETLTLAPGETKIVMHFVVQGEPGDLAGVSARAEALSNLTAPDALLGITPEERAQMVNW